MSKYAWLSMIQVHTNSSPSNVSSLLISCFSLQSRRALRSSSQADFVVTRSPNCPPHLLFCSLSLSLSVSVFVSVSLSLLLTTLFKSLNPLTFANFSPSNHPGLLAHHYIFPCLALQ